MGQFDLKGTFPQSPSWVEVVAGGGISSSPWKIRFWNIKDVAQGLQDHDPDLCMMVRGTTVHRLQEALTSSPAGLATPASRCGARWNGRGRGWPGNAGQPRGGGWQTRATLTPGPRTCTPSPPEIGLAVLITATPCGTRQLVGTGPRTDAIPFTSSGLGHWHTLKRMVQAWGLAAWGPG
jgi:hypothetical protein